MCVLICPYMCVQICLFLTLQSPSPAVSLHVQVSLYVRPYMCVLICLFFFPLQLKVLGLQHEADDEVFWLCAECVLLLKNVFSYYRMCSLQLKVLGLEHEADDEFALYGSTRPTLTVVGDDGVHHEVQASELEDGTARRRL